MSYIAPPTEGALCQEVGGDFFFLERGDNAVELSKIQEVCSECKVQLACLNYAVKTGQTHGVWGGFTGKKMEYLIRLGKQLKAVPAYTTLKFKPKHGIIITDQDDMDRALGTVPVKRRADHSVAA